MQGHATKRKRPAGEAGRTNIVPACAGRRFGSEIMPMLRFFELPYCKRELKFRERISIAVVQRIVRLNK